MTTDAMKPLLLEPTDVLFFRDAVPMSAGQGKGAGCRMPFPSTIHEAFRSSLLLVSDRGTGGKTEEGRPRHAPKRGSWHDRAWPEEDRRRIATRAFRSFRTVGPLPFLESARLGLLLPMPLDVAFERDPDQEANEPPRFLRRLVLWRDNSVTSEGTATPSAFRVPCLPCAVTPPDKHAQLHDWWTVQQYTVYLSGDAENRDNRFRPLPTDSLWQAEHRIGVEIAPDTFAARSGQLYAGAYLRPHADTRFAVQAWSEKPANGEEQELNALDWLLLGGERRLARVWHDPKTDPFAALPPAPEVNHSGPCLLKWVMVTPAIFRHGSLPGWCADTKRHRLAGLLPVGRVCLELPGRAQLISWCLGKPLAISGWDVVEGRAKPTQLAVPAGSVYYFLCENAETGNALAKKMHWQPRSDFYGEKGCGYGLCSFDVKMHATSADVSTLARELLI